MQLTRKNLRKIVKEEVRNVLNEEYLELIQMNSKFDKGVEMISKAFQDWARSPGASESDFNAGLEEVINHIRKELKSVK